MDASDEREVKRREDAVARARRLELEDTRRILDTVEGRRFFRRMFARGKLFETTFTGNSHGYFLEGHRNLVLTYLRDICESAPERVQSLMAPDNIEEVKNA